MELYNTWPFVSSFFTQHDVFRVYPCCGMYQHFIIFYGRMNFVVPMYHTLFINSSVGGHLGYLYFLAIANSTAMNIREKVFAWTTVLCLTYWWATELFSTGTVPFYIPTSNVLKVLNSLRSCQQLLFSCFVLFSFVLVMAILVNVK